MEMVLLQMNGNNRQRKPHFIPNILNDKDSFLFIFFNTKSSYDVVIFPLLFLVRFFMQESIFSRQNK